MSRRRFRLFQRLLRLHVFIIVVVVHDKDVYLSCACFANAAALSINRNNSQEVCISLRSKLFIFGETLLEKGTGNKSWRERGVGEIRILRHREHQRLRVLMRQEKTMKVICNHALDPRITLEPNVGSDRSWVWSAFDFAEGELSETVFAIRFADSDIAGEFKTKFTECQKEMEKLLEGADSPDADGAADEAAKALGDLKTTADDDDDDDVDV